MARRSASDLIAQANKRSDQIMGRPFRGLAGTRGDTSFTRVTNRRLDLMEKNDLLRREASQLRDAARSQRAFGPASKQLAAAAVELERKADAVRAQEAKLSRGLRARQQRMQSHARMAPLRQAGRIAGNLARSGDVRLLAAGAAIGLGAYAVNRFRQRQSAGPQPTPTGEPSSLSRAYDVATTTLAAVGLAQNAQAIGHAASSAANAVTSAVTGEAAVAASAAAIGAGSNATTAQKVAGKVNQKLAARAAATGKGVKTAAVVQKLAQTRTVAALDRAVSGRTITTLGRLALPLLAARAVYNGVTGFQKDGVVGAALGVADTVTAGRASAAVDGYRAGGVRGAADGASFGLITKVAGNAPASPAAMQPAAIASAGPAPGKAYLNDGARDRASAPAVTPSGGATRVAGAGRPGGDGTTAGYQRIDKRTGQTVTVSEYKTPGA